MVVYVRPDGGYVSIGTVPSRNVDDGLIGGFDGLSENITVISPRAEEITCLLFGVGNFVGFGIKVQHKHVCQRYRAVKKSQGQHRHHTVFDDVLFAPTSKENNEGCERKNGHQFNGYVPDLGCT